MDVGGGDDTTLEGYSRPCGYDCPIARYRRSHSSMLPITRTAFSDCYSFFSVSPANRMTTLTTSLLVTKRPLFIAGAPEVNLLCVGVFIAHS